MPDILIVILAVIFVLGIAINIHEFGHFMVAKFFGMRVEAYSFFGLGPRIWGFKVGHTDYRISAIPLGAYVKLYGDEATAALEGGESEGEPVPESELYELRPRWQKFLVMLGGPFMNILLALAIPFGAAMIYGIPSMPAPVVGVVNAGGAADQSGIMVGDRIVSFNGAENPTWEGIRDESMISPDKELALVVDRGGQRIPLTVTPSKQQIDGNALGEIGLLPDAGVEPVEVGTIAPDSPAAASGLQQGDRVLAFNGQTVRNSQELSNQIKENKDAPARITIERYGERNEIQTAAKLAEDGVYRIGIGFGTANITTRVNVGLAGAAAYAVDSNLRIMRLTGKVFGQMFAGERSVKDAGLAGPVGIVQIISKVVQEAGFAGLVMILGVISLNLGVFNLLPIPLLDGGQIMVLGIEKVMSWFGKTLSMAIKEKIQLAGLAVILILMAFTLFLDISRFF
ncbi:MAG: RIP metalloprotease RseP [Acidobacteriota bacterium]|nr:RIP metalloprotease RseP [Blastocatellia bacterium]MDQ3490868.1 RIP metalloprotease RseP [Acidobacteriota bacterium]